MKTIMYMVGYDSRFKSSCNTGWGCGYVMIPVEYAIVQRWLHVGEEDDPYDQHLQVLESGQEITYTTEKTIDGQKYIVIGFDTAHSYNTPQHDFDWVLKETHKLQQVIEEHEHAAQQAF